MTSETKEVFRMWLNQPVLILIY